MPKKEAGVELFMKSCPFCHEKMVFIRRASDGRRFAVECDNPSCRARGPVAHTAQVACTLWNEAPRPEMPEDLDAIHF